MPIEAVKLHFDSPLHIGSGMEELDKTTVIYSSDALKSALFSAGLAFYPEWEINPESFFNNFRISSCFPYCGEDLFLPRPIGLMKFTYGNEKEDDKSRKQSKKISFLSLDLVQKWVKNQETELFIDKNCISPDGNFVFSIPQNVKSIYQNEVQQRVSVSLKDGGSTPFYLGRIYFEQDAGLYFLLECNNEKLKQKLFNTLQLLGDLGIGTDRTVGNGLFSINEKEDVLPIQLPDSNNLSKKISLGLYLPRRDEIEKINFDRSSWNITKRGGFIAGSSIESMRHLRKNNIYFFTEGSAFHVEGPLKGKFVDLKPDWNDENLHPVWRDGRPIFINL